MNTDQKISRHSRPYRPEDRGAVLDLFELVWGRKTRQEHEFLWDWKHLRDGEAPAFNVAKILESNGKVAGYSGSLPARVRIADQVYFSSVVMDTAVDPGSRGQGIKLLLSQFKGHDVIYGVPINMTNNLWAKMARRKIENINIKKHLKMVRIIDPAHVLARKGVPLFLRPAATLALKLYFALVDLRSGRRSPCRLEKVDRFPQEIDAVCAEYGKNFKFIALRDREFLNWRYERCPIPYEKIVLRRDNRLCGYMVYRLCSIGGRKVLLLLEAAATGLREENYQALLAHVVDEAKRDGASDIQTLDCGCPLFRKLLKRNGFAEKPGRHPFIGSLNDGLMAQYEKELFGKNIFHLSLGDGDFEFIFFAFDGKYGIT